MSLNSGGLSGPVNNNNRFIRNWKQFFLINEFRYEYITRFFFPKIRRST